MRAVQKISSHVIWERDIYWRRYKIQETLSIGRWHPSPLQSRYLGTSHSSPSISSTVQNSLQNPLLESPSAALLYFSEFHGWYEISSLSKVILVLGKARSHMVLNLGCSGAESPGWFDVSPKNLMQICCSTCSVILNATATQYTCSLNSIYRPHWLVQWSHHCSCLHIPFHFLWPPDYIDTVQMVLIKLSMAGLFMERPHSTWWRHCCKIN